MSKAPCADCSGCPGEGRDFVPPEPARAPRCRLAIVGEGPGRNEVEHRRPFVGPSGRAMMRHLASLGLGRGDAHWTNAVLCDVPEKDLEVARKRCAKRLQAELAAAGAPVVVPVGALAAKSALMRTGATPIQKWRGSVNEVSYGGEHPGDEKGGVVVAGKPGGPKDPQCESTVEAVRPASAWVLPTIHPAFVMRAPQWEAVLKSDMQRVGRFMRDGAAWVPPELVEGRQVLIAKEWDHLDALDTLGDEESFDVETVGLGPTQTALVCFVISDAATTIVVPWSRGRDGREPWWQRPQEVAARVTKCWRQRRTVTHNGPAFDHLVAERYGLHIAEWEDTLLMAHALWPGLPKGLSHVVTAVGLDVPPWKQLEMRTGTIEQLWAYCGRDGLYTVLAYWRLRELLQQVAA